MDKPYYMDTFGEIMHPEEFHKIKVTVIDSEGSQRYSVPRKNLRSFVTQEIDNWMISNDSMGSELAFSDWEISQFDD